MTLILGIKCTDGIVLGADGAATFGSMGNATIRQATRKLIPVDGCIVIGVSGPVGLGQRIVGTIESLWRANKFSNKQPFEASTIIREAIGKHISMEIQAAIESSKLIGQGVAAQSALTHTAVAMPVNRRLCLFQFDQQGAPEEASTDLPFIAIGSGQMLADPFLGFIRCIFWKPTGPTTAEGIFAAIWTLIHAIRMNPGGVSDPIQIMSLTGTGSNAYTIRELAEAELQEHKENVEAVEHYLSNYPNASTQGQPDEPPTA